MWLDAEIFRSQLGLNGNRPQYAPEYSMRGGFAYLAPNGSRLLFSGTWLDSHFANDSNDANFFIPAYSVWDLTAEFRVWNRISVVAGVNNIFDELYTSRITSVGIDPADGRNYYLGGRLDY